MLGKSIRQNSLLLGLFALATAGLIASTFALTEARIVAAERRAAQQALLEIVPANQHDNDLLSDTLALQQAFDQSVPVASGQPVHVARREGRPVAFIVPTVAPDGYSGDIKLLVGVSTDGTVAGVRVLAHKETPGLGDKIELAKSDWIRTFEGKSLNQPSPQNWKVRKDGGSFDQFTGATITPRAVVSQVKAVLQFVTDNQAALLAEAQHTSPHSPADDTAHSGSSPTAEAL